MRVLRSVSVLPAGFEPALSGRRPEILDRTRLRERKGTLGIHAQEDFVVLAPSSPQGAPSPADCQSFANGEYGYH